jgi:cytochrome P450
VRGYGARMAVTSGPFLLGYDTSTPEYQREAALVRKVVRPSDGDRVRAIVKSAATTVAEHLAGKGGAIDRQSFTAATLSRLLGQYFGVPGPNDETLFKWLLAISVYIFTPFVDTPFVDAEMTGAAGRAGAALTGYLDRLIVARSPRLAGSADRSDEDDVLARLLAEARDPADPIDVLTVRRTIGGLVSGTMIPLALTFLGALQGLDAHPEHRAAAQRAARRGDRAAVLRYLYEAARFAPRPDQLYRVCVRDTRLEGSETTIAAGKTVVVSLGSAMMDPMVFEAPERFSIDRDLDSYSFFGFGSHACLGKFLTPIALEEMGLALLTSSAEAPCAGASEASSARASSA